MISRPLIYMLLFLTGLIGGTVLIAFLLILPTVQDIFSLNDQLIAEQQILEAQYAQGKRLKQLRDDWEKVQEDLPLLEGASVLQQESVTFITRLESISEQHQVQHRITLPLDEKNSGAEELQVPFQLHWKGEWVNLLRNLLTIEQEPYFLPISKIEIRAEKSSSASLSLQPFTNFALPEPREASPELPLTMTLSGTTIWKTR